MHEKWPLCPQTSPFTHTIFDYEKEDKLKNYGHSLTLVCDKTLGGKWEWSRHTYYYQKWKNLFENTLENSFQRCSLFLPILMVSYFVEYF